MYILRSSTLFQVHRLAPVDELHVTGLGQRRTEIESKHLDTPYFDTAKTSIPMFVLVILHFDCILQKYWCMPDWKLKNKNSQPFVESLEKFARTDICSSSSPPSRCCCLFVQWEETITQSPQTTMQRQQWKIMSWGSHRWPSAIPVFAMTLAIDVRRGMRCRESLPWASGFVLISPASRASCQGLLCPFSLGGLTG